MMRSLAMLALVAGALPAIPPAHAQEFSRDEAVMFEAVTLDDSALHLSRAQTQHIARIAGLARAGKVEAAKAEWQSFLKLYYRRGSAMNLNAIESLIVRDAFFNDRKLLDIGRRYRQSLDSAVQPAGKSGDLAGTETLAREIESLRKGQSETNAGNEMLMMQLQDAMQRRSQIVQALSQVSGIDSRLDENDRRESSLDSVQSAGSILSSAPLRSSVIM